MALREASGTQNPVFTRVISGHCVLGLRLGKVVGPLLLHFWEGSFIIWGTLLRLHVVCSENGLPCQTASLVCLCRHTWSCIPTVLENLQPDALRHDFVIRFLWGGGGGEGRNSLMYQIDHLLVYS